MREALPGTIHLFTGAKRICSAHRHFGRHAVDERAAHSASASPPRSPRGRTRRTAATDTTWMSRVSPLRIDDECHWSPRRRSGATSASAGYSGAVYRLRLSCSAVTAASRASRAAARRRRLAVRPWPPAPALSCSSRALSAPPAPVRSASAAAAALASLAFFCSAAAASRAAARLRAWRVLRPAGVRCRRASLTSGADGRHSSAERCAPARPRARDSPSSIAFENCALVSRNWKVANARIVRERILELRERSGGLADWFAVESFLDAFGEQRGYAGQSVQRFAVAGFSRAGGTVVQQCIVSGGLRVAALAHRQARLFQQLVDLAFDERGLHRRQDRLRNGRAGVGGDSGLADGRYRSCGCLVAREVPGDGCEEDDQCCAAGNDRRLELGFAGILSRLRSDGLMRRGLRSRVSCGHFGGLQRGARRNRLRPASPWNRRQPRRTRKRSGAHLWVAARTAKTPVPSNEAAISCSCSEAANSRTVACVAWDWTVPISRRTSSRSRLSTMRICGRRVSRS